MRYIATFERQESDANTAVEVEVSSRADALSQVRYVRDNLAYAVDSQFSETSGGVSLIINGESTEAHVETWGDSVRVEIRNQVFNFGVADPLRYQAQALSKQLQAAGPRIVRAPMPGRVVKILVASGTEVEAGQGLVVIEAMKMENELKSPSSGRVSSVWVTEGSAVENNAALITLEQRE